jgi:prepilin-type N-terminal cleavage/methylation domain-containing protein
MKKGFTLIELLIVVLIIAILAAIAIPNFLEFQTRAKVSRVKSDHRSLATGIEAYYVDCNEYPAMATQAMSANGLYLTGGAYNICTFRIRNYGVNGATQTMLKTLTTPIAYITGYFPDPFASSRGSFFPYRQYPFTWLLFSYGPDRDENSGMNHTNAIATLQMMGGIDYNFETVFNIDVAQPSNQYMAGIGMKGSALHYDPTNGTTSAGDIVRNKN